MTKRCERNRKRSKRRAIYCPSHGCYLDSVGPKRMLFADSAQQLQARGMNRKRSLMVMANQSTVPLQGEWLEAFWCQDCQETTWYHVQKTDDRTYKILPAPRELWHQAHGIIHPNGNPSVGEFTRFSARMVGYQGIKMFNLIS